jgi:hypothetical protein
MMDELSIRSYEFLVKTGRKPRAAKEMIKMQDDHLYQCVRGSPSPFMLDENGRACRERYTHGALITKN